MHSVTNIYVSPMGNDVNPETKELPLASLNGAKNHVRQVKTSAKGDITVWLRGGTYYLNETVVFSLEDSGEGESTISYQAYPDEKPVFSSTIEISSWNKPENTIPSLPEIAQGKVWVANIPKIMDAPWHYYTLYNAEGRLPRARSKGFIPTTISSGLSSENKNRNLCIFRAVL